MSSPAVDTKDVRTVIEKHPWSKTVTVHFDYLVAYQVYRYSFVDGFVSSAASVSLIFIYWCACTGDDVWNVVAKFFNDLKRYTEATTLKAHREETADA